MNKYITLPILAASCVSANAAITSLAGTGWDKDIIVESTAASSAAGAQAATNANFSAWYFYEAGWNNGTTAGPTGLNSTGTYASSTASYQMQAYTANNAFVNGGTFTLTAPQKLDTINFLVVNQGAAAWSATVNYGDGTSSAFNLTGIDWTSPATDPKVISDPGLVGTATGNPGHSNTFLSNVPVYVTERSVAVDPMKAVNSITFGNTGGNSAIFGISGQVVPEPSSAALLGLGGLALIMRRRK